MYEFQKINHLYNIEISQKPVRVYLRKKSARSQSSYVNPLITLNLFQMKQVKDNFSNQTKFYKKYRPTYPIEIYQELLPFVKTKEQCWDCGTGNGQVAIHLTNYFQSVYATDISQKQLDNAEKHERITYKVERAEKTSFSDNQFDLITCAQAAHWFDSKAFNKEVKRVGKKGAIISIWGYGLLRIAPKIDKLIDKFYFNILGSYWDEERKHIDYELQTIPFDFNEIPTSNDKSIQTNWNLNELEGYFNSWSSVQHFNKSNPNTDPVQQIILEIKNFWKENEVKEVKFPIFMRVGNIDK